MSPWLRVVVIGGVVIVAFDTLAATASKLAGFPYSNAVIGSWLLYFAVGFFAARATNSLRRAALAGGIVGAIDATLGWGISWMIGPGRPPTAVFAVPAEVFLSMTVILVALSAAVIGAIAGLFGKERPPDVTSAT